MCATLSSWHLGWIAQIELPVVRSPGDSALLEQPTRVGAHAHPLRLEQGALVRQVARDRGPRAIDNAVRWCAVLLRTLE